MLLGGGGRTGGSPNSNSPTTTTTDRVAVDRLLYWMRAGSIDATSVFRMIVAGTDVNDPHFNIGVLSVTQILCVLGGPYVLAGALHVTHARRPSAVLRIIMDVLRTHSIPTYGANNRNRQHASPDGGGTYQSPRNNEPEPLLYDDQLIHDLRRDVLFSSSTSAGDNGGSYSPRQQHRQPASQRDETRRALQAYAVMLGRKFIFHQRFLDIEVNYSLDRFFRAFHLENQHDNSQTERQSINAERHAFIVSQPALADVTFIASIATVTAILLERVHANRDAFIFTLADAVNAAAFQAYLAKKQTKSQQHNTQSKKNSSNKNSNNKDGDNNGDNSSNDEYCIDRELAWLRAKTAALVERPTKTIEMRLLKKLIDPNVYRWLQQTAPPTSTDEQRARACRPGSRHRKDIMCHFSSFQSMHSALMPASLR